MAVIIKVKVSLARTRPRPRPSAGCSLTTFHFLRPAAPRWRHTSSSQPPPAPSSCCCWYSAAAAAAVQHQCAKTAAAENFLRAFRARSRDRAPADRDGVFSDDEQHTGGCNTGVVEEQKGQCAGCVCTSATSAHTAVPLHHMFTCSHSAPSVYVVQKVHRADRGVETARCMFAILKTLEKPSNNDMSASLNQGLQEKEKANINICNCSDFSPMNTLMVHRRSGVREV